MAGFGRCGEWFAVDHWGVTPDLICFAKGVNSGYVPLGGVVISDAIADTFAERAFPGGLTYSGHPLACASAVASIPIFQEEGILENARKVGDDRHRPRAGRDRPSSTRASARCAGSACSGRSSWCATARPASRSCRTTPAAPPPRRWPSSPRPARPRACGRSCTSTAPTSCRRARPPPTRWREGLDHARPCARGRRPVHALMGLADDVAKVRGILTQGARTLSARRTVRAALARRPPCPTAPSRSPSTSPTGRRTSTRSTSGSSRCAGCTSGTT